MYDLLDAHRHSLPAPMDHNPMNRKGNQSWAVLMLVASLMLVFSTSDRLTSQTTAQEAATQETTTQETTAQDADAPKASDQETPDLETKDQETKEQETKDQETPDQETATKVEYTSAIQLIPESAAGLIRIPNLPKFREALKETLLGQLREEELVKPFFDAQRERLRNYLESVNNKIGIKVDDLYEISSGEVVLAWLPFPNEKRRPYSLCLVADIRGRKDKADAALATIDKDLKAAEWARKDVIHQGETVRVYGAKRRPGQIKVKQIAICVSDVRIITADRESVVTGILDAVAGKPSGKSISEQPEFKKVIRRAGVAIQGPVKAQGGTLVAEWFARPFAMGRIIRDALEVDRGNDIDIIKLLENQGFGAVKAAGGVVAINGEKYDMLHKGVILATRPFDKAARILQFDAKPHEQIPAWVAPETASFNRLNLKIEDAFWASGTLIDEALGDEIFDDMIEGIHKDKDGPQIDVRNDVLPSLDNQIILITDNTMPADISSERLLAAIRVSDAGKIKETIEKAMEAEPDASKMDTPDLKGTDIWRVELGAGGDDDDFDEELFGDFDFGEDESEEDEVAPLLDRWAIALIPQGPGSKSAFLMFSSHPELLIATAKRIQNGANDGLATLPEVKEVVEALKELGVKNPIFDRVIRSKLSFRVKYELLRQGKLRESDSLLAKLFQRIAEEEEANGKSDPLDVETLPPLEQIGKYLPNGGSYIEETEDGWEMTGFYLK